MRTLFVTPQRNEFDRLLDSFAREGSRVDSVRLGSIDGAEIPDLEATMAIGGHGKAQFAAQTQYLISRLPDVELVVCVGAGGALVDRLSPEDLVVATHTVEHDYKLRFAKEPYPVHEGDPRSIEQLQVIVERANLPFDVHFGKIAGGDEDVTDRDRARTLHKQTEALCVAWEGSGGARAAALNELPFLEIRAITDTADDSAPDDFQRNLDHTITHISTLLIQWLKE